MLRTEEKRSTSILTFSSELYDDEIKKIVTWRNICIIWWMRKLHESLMRHLVLRGHEAESFSIYL